MTGIWSGAKSERNEALLEALMAEARRDLARLNFPAPGWVPKSTDAAGRPVLDVLIIGGGMCGQTLAFALMRDGIRNFRVIDRNARGDEGPWGTYARMEILRSPKHLTGPDLGVPSLTFRAWYEAQYGADGFARLHKAGRLDWRDYLLFVRDTVGIPVENGIEATSIGPARDWTGGLEVRLRRADGDGGGETIRVRRVVLASGRGGAGGLRLPSIDGLDRREAMGRREGGRVLHAAVCGDLGRFSGGPLAVLGAGASAFDVAASALEGGVERVTMLVRRAMLPQINKSKWTAFAGFLKGFASLDDATRWRFFQTIFNAQVPPPYESVLRCDVHPGFEIRFGVDLQHVASDPDGVTITTGAGSERFSALILATGFDVNLTLEPLLAPHVREIATWADRLDEARIAAHANATDAETARFPYLRPGMELTEREAGCAPWLARVHLFNWGVTVSQGALAGDIPGLAIGAGRLSEALCQHFLAEDVERHWAALEAHDDRELEPTRRFVAPDERG